LATPKYLKEAFIVEVPTTSIALGLTGALKIGRFWLRMIIGKKEERELR